MKNRVSNILVTFGIVFLTVLQSCAPSREMAYITDAERDSAQQIIASYANSIHSGDQLYIYVYSETPESVIPFNQETHRVAAQANLLNHIDTSHRGVSHVQEVAPSNPLRLRSEVSGYLVDDAGTIIFPVLGRMYVEGITYDSLSRVIEKHLVEGGYLNDPIVTVSPMNFRVSVVGEVRAPQELHVTGDRLTLLEALAMCGDMTEYGVRESVVVVRERNGSAVPIVVDLTKKTLFDSECYYLQHNDIVYVEPSTTKKKQSNYDSNLRYDISSYVRLGTAIWRLMYTSYRRYVIDRKVF